MLTTDQTGAPASDGGVNSAYVIGGAPLHPGTLALGIAAAAVLCAANLFLGLKVGLTFSAAIPVAAVAAAIPHHGSAARRLSALTVQSIAAAASTMPVIIFVLPALLLVGHWQGFPFLQTATLAAGGGILGVAAALVLARPMLADSALPFPEAVAVAEILQLDSNERPGCARTARTAAAREPAGRDLKCLLLAAGGAALLAILHAAKLLPSVARMATQGIGGSIWSVETEFSLALVGAGYLTGSTTGLAMLLGLAVAWGAAVPILTLGSPASADLAGLAHAAWNGQARMIGAGMMAVGAIWSLARLAGPLLRAARRPVGRSASPGGAGPRAADSDRWRLLIPPCLVAVAALAVGIGVFAAGSPAIGGALAAIGLLGAIALGLLLAPPAATMAGMIGTSCSPISSIGLVAVAAIAGALSLVRIATGGSPAGFTALALFLGSAVMAMAAMANGGVECLKTARLVGAPIRGQAVALLIGVVVCALATPLVLQMLYAANGLAGDTARGLAHPSGGLAAPQAAMMALLSTGIIEGHGDWTMLEIGAALGVAIISIDHMLRRIRPGVTLPVLGVGLGAYLPAGTTMALVLGALLSWLVERRLTNRHDIGGDSLHDDQRRRGVLIASGMIVGESVCGIALAGVAVMQTGAPTGLPWSGWVDGSSASLAGIATFGTACLLLARGVLARSAQPRMPDGVLVGVVGSVP